MSKHYVSSENPLPLYYQVYNSLKERIEDGEFAPGAALPPERQLVDDYGVSRITVVKALDKLENDDLIERQHGRGTFVKQPAPAESVQQLTVIGFLPSGILHPFHYSVQLGIAEVTTQNRCILQVFGLDDAEYHNIDNILNLIKERMDGLIVYPRQSKQDLKLYQRLLEMGLPLVMVDRYYDEIVADYAGYDGNQAGYELTRLLIERGHERIAILPHYEVNTSSIRDRIAGYRRAMREAGLNDIEDMIWLDQYAEYRPTLSQKGNPEMTESLLAKLTEYKPTALVGINHDVAERLTFDLMTINAERARAAIAQNGSPNYELNVEIATFGVNPPEDYGPYAVAVAYQPGERLGQQAAEMLMERVKDDYQGPPRAVELPIEIIVRK